MNMSEHIYYGLDTSLVNTNQQRNKNFRGKFQRKVIFYPLKLGRGGIHTTLLVDMLGVSHTRYYEIPGYYGILVSRHYETL